MKCPVYRALSFLRCRSPRGERGLKSRSPRRQSVPKSRSPRGERGLKSYASRVIIMLALSLSSRRAWIEIKAARRPLIPVQFKLICQADHFFISVSSLLCQSAVSEYHISRKAYYKDRIDDISIELYYTTQTSTEHFHIVYIHHIYHANYIDQHLFPDIQPDKLRRTDLPYYKETDEGDMRFMELLREICKALQCHTLDTPFVYITVRYLFTPLILTFTRISSIILT